MIARRAMAMTGPILAAALVTAGAHLYRRHCASCHGRSLQGQPLWQLMDENAGRRAPAHDASGHTWQHADDAIFRMTKEGTAVAAAPGAVGAMPAFKDKLSDRDVLAVIAFIKARWPLGLRISQALLNPGYAGLPADAATMEWRLPPTCNAVLRRATLTSRKGGQDRRPASLTLHVGAFNVDFTTQEREAALRARALRPTASEDPWLDAAADGRNLDVHDLPSFPLIRAAEQCARLPAGELAC